jgi:leader peptidase (prepilin peptidase)/N-methyltransferase
MVLVSDISPWLIRAFAFAFGSIWGSFFNVAIYRWPRELSVVSPPSHCPACGVNIPAARNLPIFGWLILRGKAACCGAPITPRYPLVELISALLCVALAERFIVAASLDTSLLDGSLLVLIYFAFVGGLVIASFVDLDFMEIPDEVSLPGAALGLITATYRDNPGAADAAIGAGAGFLLVQLVFVWAYERLAGRRGMGEGDSKLLMMIGAFLGWQGALVALVLGAFQGLIIAGLFIATGRSIEPAGLAELDAMDAEEEKKRREEAGSEGEEEEREEEEEEASEKGLGQLKIPYGPFLALGALEFLFFGEYLVERYVGLFFY